MSENLFDKITVLKEKFKDFFTHKKKFQALENYSSAVPFEHKDYLLLIKRCMADGFLGEKEADFLCYMLDKYQVNHLDWSHKTKWLKGEIERLSCHYKPKEVMPAFDFSMLSPKMDSKIPFELLAQHQKQQQSRRA